MTPQGLVAVRVLGPVEAEVAGRSAPLRSRRQQALLALFSMHAGTVVSVSRIGEALWEDGQTGVAANTVQTTVSRLRRSLGPGRDAIVTRAPGYLFAVDGEAIDARRFELGCRDAQAAMTDEPHRAVDLLDHALALWRGRAYGQFADSFARAEATRLEELRVAALEHRAWLALATGSVEEAILRASGLTASHPTRDRPVTILMQALHRAGRTPDALAVYRGHRQRLDDELGLAPSAALQSLEAQILRDELPTPAALPAPVVREPRRSSTRLPWLPSPLIGREQDLDRIRDRLGRGRTVTIRGPGGVGKTRLALEVAHEHERDGSPVCWVDLSTAGPGGVADAIAEAAETELAHDEDRTRRLCTVLSSRRGLLCLDNAEHILDEVAEIVECLGASASGLGILVTSRERLGLDTEVVHALPPLPLPDGPDRSNPGVQLFLQRWLGDPDEGSTDDVTGVAHLVRRLDGLPLAIELAAAQTASLGLRSVTERLGARLDLLTGGRRTSAPRHRTLRAVVGWSAGLLSRDQAELFGRLAVFPAAFTLDQVEAVCAGEGLDWDQVAPLLSRLVEQSLIQARADRFWLLETLRAYAAERLDRDTAERLRARHAHDTGARLQRVAQPLWTADEAAAVAAIDRLLPDLHAAWEHASAHDPDLAVELAADVFGFAYIRQRLDLLRWSLSLAARDIRHPRWPDVLAAAAAAAWAGGRMEPAQRLATRGIEVAGGPDQPAAASAMDVHADLLMFEGRSDDAASSYRMVADLQRRSGSELGALLAEIAETQARCYGPDPPPPDRVGGLVDRARASGNPTTMAFAWFVAGEADARSDPDAALEAYARAVHHGSVADSRLFVALARHAGADLALMRDVVAGDTVGQFVRVLGDWQQIDNEAGQWTALRSIVVLLARLGLDDAAVRLGGAVEANRESRWHLGPHAGEAEDSLVAALRDRLGDLTFERAWAAGAGMPLGTAVTTARTLLEVVRQRGVSELYAS